MTDEMKEKKRYYYLDVLRIIAIPGVITIHATCQVINSSVFEMSPIGSKKIMI